MKTVQTKSFNYGVIVAASTILLILSCKVPIGICAVVENENSSSTKQGCSNPDYLCLQQMPLDDTDADLYPFRDYCDAGECILGIGEDLAASLGFNVTSKDPFPEWKYFPKNQSVCDVFTDSEARPSWHCNDNYLPVECGKDNCIYDNFCKARLNNFNVFYCGTFVDCPIPTKDASSCRAYEPVLCGENNCSYNSLCHAENAGYTSDQCLPRTSCTPVPASAAAECTALGGDGYDDFGKRNYFIPVACSPENCLYDSQCEAHAAGYSWDKCVPANFYWYRGDVSTACHPNSRLWIILVIVTAYFAILLVL